MNNKYIILTAMYRYGILYMEDKPSLEQIRDVLTTTNPHTVIPGSKMLVKKALNDNYGIKNLQDAENVIDGLMEYVFTDGIVYSGLIDLFLNAPGDFASMSYEQAEEYLRKEEKLREYITPFSPVQEQFHLTEDLNDCLEDIKISILYFFQPENAGERKSLSQLFEKNRSWLALTKGRSMAGFHLSRLISIIADATMCGYLEDSKAEELLNHYGAFAEALFDNWETFLSSALFGKLLMSSNSGTFILDSSDYVKSCYKLAAHEGRLLEVSGLWTGSDTTELCRCLGETYGVSLEKGESKAFGSDPRYAFVQATILPVFEKYGVEYLLDQEMCELSYTVPVSDTESGPYYDMEALIKKKRFEQSSGEIPFIAHSKLLVTDQSIRIIEKKLFGSKLHTFSWTQKLQFSYDFTKLDLIAFKVNGITMFHMPRNYKKAGISKKDDVFLDKEQVLKHYSEDIRNALLAFSELNQVLGEKRG
ncbi:DUF1266 domain-containing protein [Lacrimispora sp. JR3]|uniref:DUF1266 domain-containing protein n=1 Tax=Lacrimispora sinapis TaxID=3111456 RepID=UPI00374A2B68